MGNIWKCMEIDSNLSPSLLKNRMKNKLNQNYHHEFIILSYISQPIKNIIKSKLTSTIL